SNGRPWLHTVVRAAREDPQGSIAVRLAQSPMKAHPPGIGVRREVPRFASLASRRNSCQHLWGSLQFLSLSFHLGRRKYVQQVWVRCAPKCDKHVRNSASMLLIQRGERYRNGRHNFFESSKGTHCAQMTS